MENENKWEYDYSASNNETGYPNVGSSGMNTANQYNEPEAQPARPADTAPADGGSVPPTPPEQPQYSAPAQPEKPRRKKKFNGGKLARSAVALVLAAAMGFAGGFVGAKYGGGSKVVIQQVERPASSDSSTDSTGNSISATSGTGLSTAQVAELVSPSVVVITTEQVVYSQWSWYGQSQVESGAGSGVIISSDGYILTCAHVVSGASNITVSIGDKDYPATLVGEDTTSDIAVVKVDATGLTPATVGDSDNLKVGESVMAVGNPLGELGGTVTSGIVSALNRSVSIQGSSSVNTMSLIQMDASVSPGNSGGGLFNMNGELVGIVNAKSSDSDAEGLGFAIPVNDAVKVAQELLENGYVTGRPYLGISYYAVTDAQTAAQLGVNAYGGYIVEVGKVEDVFLNPQSDMAKQLIFPAGRRTAKFGGGRTLRLVFDGETFAEPVIGSMVIECGAAVNILFADLNKVEGKTFGQMLIELPDQEQVAQRMLAYLELHHIHFEEEDHHV